MKLTESIFNDPVVSQTVGRLSQPTIFPYRFIRFQRNYLWDVLMPDVGNVLGLLVSQYCSAVEFGDYNLTDTISMRAGVYEFRFPGLLSIETVRMRFFKGVPDFVTMYFYAWRNLMIDNLGLYNVKSEYQRNIYIRFLDQTGIAINRYKLINAFPKQFPSYALDYENNQVTQVPIELSVDRIEIM